MLRTVNDRAAPRLPVLRSAWISFGSTRLDCLVTNQSDTGVRISNDDFTPYPSEVTIEFRAGPIWIAARRWQRGLETGFELQRFMGLTPAAGERVRMMHERLRNTDLQLLLRDVRAASNFGLAAVEGSVDRLGVALADLEQQLDAACSRGTRTLLGT